MNSLHDHRIKFRHLHCFLEVARQKSVVRAAEQLNMTQPALSRTVHELEDILGTRLFDRSRRGARLTDAGRTFLRYAAAGTSQVAQGISVLKSGEAAGSVAFGALPNVQTRLLPEAVRRFKAEHPGVDVRIASGSNDGLLRQVAAGKLAFVLGRLASAEVMRGLVFELLYVEPLIFVTRPGHPLAESDGLALADICASPVILPEKGTIIRDEIDRYAAAHGVTVFPDLIETLAMEFAFAYVRRTDCVWAVPYGVVAAALRNGEVVRLSLDVATLNGHVGLSFDPSRELSVVARSLADRIRTVTAEI